MKTPDLLILAASAVAFPWCVAFCAWLAAHRQMSRRVGWPLLAAVPRRRRLRLRLAVLIPAYNVAANIERAIRGALADPRTALVVVVDGGSTDGTAEVARACAACEGSDANRRGSDRGGRGRGSGRRHDDERRRRRRACAAPPVVVVEAAAGLTGRANCLNLAVCVANDHLQRTPPHAADDGDGDAYDDDGDDGDDDGDARDDDDDGDGGGAYDGDDDAYVFLHADTVLPDGFGASVVAALRDGRAACGAFPIYTRGVRDHPSLHVRAFGRLANGLNNLRSSWMEAPYGDQGLCCRRSTFEAVGGFPPLPLMEDSAFVWEARRHGAVRLLGRAVHSFASPQWAAMGMLYVMRNYLFLTLWAAGVASPEWIHRLYYPRRALPRRVPYRKMASQYASAPQSMVVRAGAAATRGGVR